MKRFAYEVAEEILDDFADRQDPYFLRSYQKLKFTVTAYAFCDYGHEDFEVALARGWEELQIATVGHAEANMMGALLQCWIDLPDFTEEGIFADTLKQAFTQADEATSNDVVRLYLSRYRKLPIRIPDEDEGYSLDPIVPSHGVRFRNWANAQDEDSELLGEHMLWLEAVDRSGQLSDDDWTDEEETGPRLELLEGGVDE